jgi:hypothetical protein
VERRERCCTVLFSQQTLPWGVQRVVVDEVEVELAHERLGARGVAIVLQRVAVVGAGGAGVRGEGGQAGHHPRAVLVQKVKL